MMAEHPTHCPLRRLPATGRWATVRGRARVAATEAEADIHLDGVSKRFGDMTAVDDLTMSIPRGSFYAMLGPSGVWEDDDAAHDRRVRGPRRRARSLLGGADVTQHPPYKRRRQHGLPVVRALPAPERATNNVAFGLRAQEGRQGEALEARPRVARAGAASATSPSASRPQLSGGQQQRVALARALVNQPPGAPARRAARRART